MEHALQKPPKLTVTYDNQTLTLPQWAKVHGLAYSVLKMRYRRGDRPPELFRPMRTISPKKTKVGHRTAKIPVTYKGVTQPLRHWATDLGIPYPALHARYLRGDRDEWLMRPLRGEHSTPPAKIRFTIFGTTKTLFEWSKNFNLCYGTVIRRYKSGIRNPAELFAAR